LTRILPLCLPAMPQAPATFRCHGCTTGLVSILTCSR
jgi:hypothetical protein